MKNENLKIPLVIGVTGHRDIKEEDHNSLKKEIKEIFKKLDEKYPKTPFILLTPLSDGADRLAAKVALESFNGKITIKIPLPFDEDTYKTTFGVENLISKSDSIEEYNELKNQINLIDHETPVEIFMDFDKEIYDKLSEKDKRKIRHKQYSLVGEYIAINSHILIALENPKTEGKTGGTSEVLNKKLTGNYELLGIQNDISQPEQGIVYRINTPRLKDDENSLLLEDEKYKKEKLFPNLDNTNPAEWDDNKIKEYNFKDFKEHFFSKPCLTVTKKEQYNSFRQQHIQIECLNSLIEKNSEAIKRSVKKDIENLKKLGVEDSNIIRLASIRRAVTTISRKKQSKTNFIEKWLLAMIVFTTTIVVTKSLYSEILKESLIIVYPLIIMVFYILLTYFKNHKSSHEDFRAISEGIRVQTAWRMANINQSVALNYLARQKDELSWIRSSLRGLNIFNSNTQNNLNQININAVCSYWIDEQISYFEKNIKEYTNIENRVNTINNILFFIVTITSLLISINSYFSFYEISSSFQTFAIAIPVIFLAYYKSKQQFDGHGKTINQYELSLDSFKRAKKLLSQDNTDEKEVLKNLGQEALFENSFWTILRREKNYKTPSL